MLSCIVKLQEGEESYPLYKKEKDGLIESLKRRAEMIEGVSLYCLAFMSTLTKTLHVMRLQHHTCINCRLVRVPYFAVKTLLHKMCCACCAVHALLCNFCCAGLVTNPVGPMQDLQQHADVTTGTAQCARSGHMHMSPKVFSPKVFSFWYLNVLARAFWVACTVSACLFMHRLSMYQPPIRQLYSGLQAGVVADSLTKELPCTQLHLTSLSDLLAHCDRY